MIHKTLQKRKYVLEYEKGIDISKELIYSMLKKTWEVTPSKNNFMPYKIHVLGPEHQNYKNLVYLNCCKQQANCDNLSVEDQIIKHSENPPLFFNITTCSYLLIFTMRLEHDPNPFQKSRIELGEIFEPVVENLLPRITALTSFEVGLFADTLSAMCAENNLDISFTGCFSRDLKTWDKIPFVKREPLMIMTIGKAKKYLCDDLSPLQESNIRPNYDKIINFVE